MKKIFILTVLPLLVFCSPAMTCPLCNKQVRDAVYDSQFYPNLLTMLSAFIVVAIIVAIILLVNKKRHKAWLREHPDSLAFSPVPLTMASIVLGIGLGGFADGILFHQILQAHGMLSNKTDATNYIGKSVNEFWDGIFHAFCLLITFIGIMMLWKTLWRSQVNRSGKILAGGLLTGWAVFNLVEGIIDHQVLLLHNVVEFAANHAIGNYLFLGLSVVMLLIGWALIRSGKSQEMGT